MTGLQGSGLWQGYHGVHGGAWMHDASASLFMHPTPSSPVLVVMSLIGPKAICNKKVMISYHDSLFILTRIAEQKTQNSSATPRPPSSKLSSSPFSSRSSSAL